MKSLSGFSALSSSVVHVSDGQVKAGLPSVPSVVGMITFIAKSGK